MELAVTGSGFLGTLTIPALLPEQVGRFTAVSLRARPVRRFDLDAVLSGLHVRDGQEVLAVDIGGDKIAASHYIIRDGAMQDAGDVLASHSNGGSGYLDALLQVAELSRGRMIPVGISFAGPVDGTRLVAGPNLPVFAREFQDRYDGDFANIFPLVEVANDAEAGIMAGALQAARCLPGVRNVVYIINGSGLGGSVLTGHMIYATEPGHIEVAHQLNIFGQRKPCGLLGAAHVCIEAVAASKAGVEDIWFQKTGERLTGREISARYLSGDQVARGLYDNSAIITAHAIKGIAEAFQLADEAAGTVVVGHGGIFHVPGYVERLNAILEQGFSYAPRILFTKDFGANACLVGAAIAVAGRHS